MSGIAETINQQVARDGPAACARCGRLEGVKGLPCLPWSQAIAGTGIVSWCSQECMDAWRCDVTKIRDDLLAIGERLRKVTSSPPIVLAIASINDAAAWLLRR